MANTRNKADLKSSYAKKRVGMVTAKELLLIEMETKGLKRFGGPPIKKGAQTLSVA